jgi:stage V sporulation protein G
VQVTEVRVYLEHGDTLRGFASITLDNCWMVRDLRIVRNSRGEFSVATPNKKQHDGTYQDIAFPVTPEARAMIEEAVLTAYRAIFDSKTPRREDSTRYG